MLEALRPGRGAESDRELLGRLLSSLRPYPWQVAGGLAAVVANAVLQLAPPYLTKIVVDEHVATGRLDGLDDIVLLYLITLTSAALLEAAQTSILQLTAQRVMFDFRVQVYRHLQRLDIAFFDRNPVGRLMTRVTSDVDVLNDLFTSGVHAIFFDLFTLAGIVFILLSLDWRLALVTFAVVPLVGLVTRWFRRNIRQSFRDVRAWVARLNASLQENIGGIATVQLFRREGINHRRFRDLDAGHRDANLRGVFYYAVFYPAIEIVATLSTASILWYGGGEVLEGELTLGALVAFLLYAQRFFRPVADISEKLNGVQAAIAASERIFGLLDTPVGIVGPTPEPNPTPGADAIPTSSSRSNRGGVRVAFEHVSFAYGASGDVLKDLSFEVRPGERVGIVGATGSGKSTVINLLLRFYDVRDGRILVNGRDIREMPLAELRSHFALVQQDVQLFSGSIASNITMGSGAIAPDSVERAVAAVGAERFVSTLEGGTLAPVAERGATFSTGQKQLLSFARALAFDRDVLLLDEATSSVDTETELAIQGALAAATAGRTTIAIAHRLATVQDMDRILVLHKGELREAGTHDELLEQGGIYARLWALQYDRDAGGGPVTSP